MLAVGSTWRRWDLHIHTPDTILNDQFGDWDEFLTTIEEQDDVKVLESRTISRSQTTRNSSDTRRTGAYPVSIFSFPTSNSA